MTTTAAGSPADDLTEPAPLPHSPHAPSGAPMITSLTARHSLRRVGLDTAYLLTAFPLGVAGFVLAVVGLALGVSTVVVWVGLPVLAATLFAISGLAQLERGRLRHWQSDGAVGTSGLSPYRRAPGGVGVVRRLFVTIGDGQRWLDVLWALVGFATSLVAFCVAVTWWALALAGTTAWVWMLWLPDGNTGLGQLPGRGDGWALEATVSTAAGLFATALLPGVLRGLAWLHASLGELLLNSRRDLTARVRHEQDARAAAQGAEAVALRRLERDIHDGPQQRLVRLSMDLGRAKRQVASDPDAAAATLDDALRQARDTLDELRALSRGIAPPLLVDRGLGVALDELVLRSAVPVLMQHAVPTSLPPHVETAAYFTVSEALTNVAKHSGAVRAEVDVRVERTDLVVRVGDAGVGGAHPGKGTGLAGLTQRIASVGGVLDIDSAPGGPTVLTARVPLT